MPLKIAYTNTIHSAGRRHPDSQNLVRKRILAKAARLFKVGAPVLMDNKPATIMAYNIAEFGRWLSTSHPVLVRLQSGELLYCRLNDLQVAEKT
jgi:hypothetical protein